MSLLSVCRKGGQLFVLAGVAFTCGLSNVRPVAHAAVAALPSCGGPNVTIPTDGPAALQKPVMTAAVKDVVGKLEALRNQEGLASVSVAAVYDQNLIFAGGFGCADLDRQVAATPLTIYLTGSVTKVITATMLMQLRDAGWLSLDDQVASYVPEAQYLTPAGAAFSPTFRQLASHTSGLQRTLNQEPPTVDELFRRLQTLKAVSDPGTAYLYSNLANAVLGNALARMVGMTFEQYVGTYIFQALGMNDSSFQPDDSVAARVATGYTRVKVTSGGVETTPVQAALRGVFDPGGGMFSTVTDMARFLMLQYRSDSPTLSAASRQEMYAPVIAADSTDSGPTSTGLYAGLGWFNLTTNPVPAMTKDGALPGFSAFLLTFPESRLGIVVLENMDATALSASSGPGAIASLAANRLAPALATATR